LKQDLSESWAMKINHQLQKFINIAISQHNSDKREKRNQIIETHKERLLLAVKPKSEHIKKLKQKQRELSVEIGKAEEELTDAGYAFEGYHSRETIAVSDFKKLGVSIPELKLRSESQITARLLAASEDEGKKILAEIGIVI